MVNHIISKCNKLAQKEYKTRWERGFTGNCTRDYNLAKVTKLL